MSVGSFRLPLRKCEYPNPSEFCPANGYILPSQCPMPIEEGYWNENSFVLQVKTTTANEVVTLPLVPGDSYNCQVGWGDGSEVTQISHYNDNSSHTYVTPETYTIVINGKFEGLNTIYNSGLDNSLIKIIQWGSDAEFVHLRFEGCINLMELPSGALTGANITEFTKASQMFWNCSSLKYIPSDIFSELTEITKFDYVFSNCTSLKAIGADLFKNNTKTTTFLKAFYHTDNLESVPPGLFDNCTEVTTFQQCFAYSGISYISSGIFDYCTKVTTFSQCFYYCQNLTYVPAGLFTNNTEVLNASGLLLYCSSLTTIPENLFASFSKCTTFTQTFYHCNSLTSIPATTFKNCSAVTDMSSLFYYCTSLTAIPTGLFDDCTQVTTFNSLFRSCTHLNTVPASLFNNCTLVENFAYLFYQTNNLFLVIPAGLFDHNINVTTFERAFAFARMTSIPIDLFANNTAVTNYIATFYNNVFLTSAVPELWNLDPEPTGTSCFYNCINASNYGDIPTDWK